MGQILKSFKTFHKMILINDAQLMLIVVHVDSLNDTQNVRCFIKK